MFHPTRKDLLIYYMFGLLALAVGVITLIFAQGNARLDSEFLKTFIGSTGEMLAFIAVILAMAYPALRSYVTDIQGEINKWEKDLADESSMSAPQKERLVKHLPFKSLVDGSGPLRKRIEEAIDILYADIRNARATYTRVLAGLIMSAISFGVALILELIHMRLFTVFTELVLVGPYAALQWSSIVFSLELMIVTYATGILLLSLYGLARLAFK